MTREKELDHELGGQGPSINFVITSNFHPSLGGFWLPPTNNKPCPCSETVPTCLNPAVVFKKVRIFL